MSAPVAKRTRGLSERKNEAVIYASNLLLLFGWLPIVTNFRAVIRKKCQVYSPKKVSGLFSLAFIQPDHFSLFDLSAFFQLPHGSKICE
jgi:hypothetical protein